MNHLSSSVNACPLQSLTASEGIPWWKRALDIICVVLALPVLGLVGLTVAAIIKVVSPGPVFFRQERVGYRGRSFLCFKFRTMFVNADTDVHKGHLEELISSNLPMTKLDGDDARVIPGGIWLRSLGLDELPQLINVLRGDMSLVGPRPCVSYEYEKYLPRHRVRCATLPGLTGLWQVNDKNNTTFEEMMDLDVYYVHNKSLWMDLSILVRTVPAVLLQTRDVRRKKRNARRMVLVPGATVARAIRSPDQHS
jgi:lipopolysaccharide/colanic/teichoic acid biosynthesis glycosyltransferase